VDDHARGFVHDRDVGVFIKDIERDGFGLDAGRLLFRDFELDDFAGFVGRSSKRSHLVHNIVTGMCIPVWPTVMLWGYSASGPRA